MTASLTLALALAVGAGVAAERGQSDRPAVPADTLPRPLVSAAPLGVEEYEAAWTAGAEEIELGRRLFFEPRLSKDASVACASCHRPELALADDRRFSTGVDDQLTLRNAPSVFNKALSVDLMWDGRAETLEAQVLLPIESPIEMALGIAGAVSFLNEDPGYAAAFESAYGGAATEARLGRALAAFLRALVVGDSPVDRFRSGDFQALTDEERAGLWLYEGRGGCWRCHHGPNFTDESFHNTGVGAVEGQPEPGRFEVTGALDDRGKFRTASLRQLTRTAPYMHDGSLSTLEEVIEFYRGGGHANAQLSEELKPLELSDQDVQNLVAFLKALSR